MNRIRINPSLPLHRNKTSNPVSSTNVQKKSFQEVLNNIGQDKEVKFSKHAMDRLKSRNIQLSNNEIQKIGGAITKANNKGIKEALILMDNTAFIASIKNKTIITAATGEQLKENIFTNIDGAVII